MPSSEITTPAEIFDVGIFQPPPPPPTPLTPPPKPSATTSPFKPPTQASKNKNATASALFGVAAIQVLVGGIGFFLYSGELRLLDKIIAFSGGIYIVLAVAARWVRLPAALIGGVLYAAYLVLQASRSMDLLMTDLIFKIPVVILLIVAVMFALRRPPVPPAEERV